MRHTTRHDCLECFPAEVRRTRSLRPRPNLRTNMHACLYRARTRRIAAILYTLFDTHDDAAARLAHGASRPREAEIIILDTLQGLHGAARLQCSCGSRVTTAIARASACWYHDKQDCALRCRRGPAARVHPLEGPFLVNVCGVLHTGKFGGVLFDTSSRESCIRMCLGLCTAAPASHPNDREHNLSTVRTQSTTPACPR